MPDSAPATEKIPRKQQILQALELPAPRYGHLALLTGADGAPLSKRNGALSLRQLREQGYLPQALANHLFRLGHSTPRHELLDMTQMAAAFEVNHLQRAPAHFDPAQLLTWQKEAVHHQDLGKARHWLGARLPAAPDPAWARARAGAAPSGPGRAGRRADPADRRSPGGPPRGRAGPR